MGRTYQFRVLAFGLSPAPYVFTRVVKIVVKHCRRQGMRLHAYLDDWLQPSISQSLSIQNRDQLLRTVLSLGFVPNWDKLELIPSQMFCFLGARFDLEKGMIGPSLDRIVRLQMVIQKMLASHSASAWEVHSLLGQTESVARLLWPGSQAFTTIACERPVVSLATQSWDYHISLGPWFRQAAEQWLNKDFLHAMIPLVHPQQDFYLFTDASLVGWGAHLGDLSVSVRPVVCSMEQRTHKCSGTSSSFVSSEVLLSGNLRLPGVAVDRQHNRGNLSEQRRGTRSRTLSFMAT